jgi:hypothetical protein
VVASRSAYPDAPGWGGACTNLVDSRTLVATNDFLEIETEVDQMIARLKK